MEIAASEAETQGDPSAGRMWASLSPSQCLCSGAYGGIRARLSRKPGCSPQMAPACLSVYLTRVATRVAQKASVLHVPVLPLPLSGRDGRKVVISWRCGCFADLIGARSRGE